MTFPFFIAGGVVLVGILALSVKGRMLKDALSRSQSAVAVDGQTTVVEKDAQR